jgi:hypothetical protein
MPWLLVSSVACFLLQPAGYISNAGRRNTVPERGRSICMLAPRLCQASRQLRENKKVSLRLKSVLREDRTEQLQDRVEREEWPTGKHFAPIHVKIERRTGVETKLGSRSLVYVNDTAREPLPSGIVPLCETWNEQQNNNNVYFTMLGEFYSERPGYLHIHEPLTEGDVPRLWVTDFGMVGDGGLVGIDVSGRTEACICNRPFLWPNAIEYVPPDAVMIDHGYAQLLSQMLLKKCCEAPCVRVWCVRVRLYFIIMGGPALHMPHTHTHTHIQTHTYTHSGPALHTLGY